MAISSVDAPGLVATLNVAALPEDVYRLTVKDTIVDLNDSFALDGDTDGVAGGDFRMDFVVDGSTQLVIFTGPSGVLPDPSFGRDGDGLVTTPVGGPNQEARGGVVVQADGKTIVAGDDLLGITLVRYNVDGSLDTTFGDIDATTGMPSGRVVTIPSVSQALIRDVVLQNDGKILIVGHAQNPTASATNAIIARYTTAGVLDTSFNSGGSIPGIATLDDFVAKSLALQSTGNIVVAGDRSNSADSDFALTRFNSNGTHDTAFGVKQVDLETSTDHANSVAVNLDDSIVVAGERYGTSGIDPAGNTVFGFDFALARFNSEGALIASFGDGGKVITPVTLAFDFLNSVVFQPDGKIVAVGYTEVIPGGFTIARYNVDGSLDTSFNQSGSNVDAFAGLNAEAHSVEIRSDGKILVAGFADDSSSGNATLPKQFALARYDFDGCARCDFWRRRAVDGKLCKSRRSRVRGRPQCGGRHRCGRNGHACRRRQKLWSASTGGIAGISVRHRYQ